MIFIWLVYGLLASGTSLELNEDQIEDNDYELASISHHSQDDDPKELFFRQSRSYQFADDTSADFSDNPRQATSYGDIPRPGGFKLYPYSSETRSRDTRSVKYKVIPSPGLKSHFQPDTPHKKLAKREAEPPQAQPNYDLQFIQGTASNKDVISQNYAKSIVEEVTRTATLAGHLPGYDLKFIKGTATPRKEEEVTTELPKSELVTVVQNGEKPLEITILDKEDVLPNITQLPLVTSPPAKEPVESELSINDFIRFRRNTHLNQGKDSGSLKAEARHSDNVPEESVVSESGAPLEVRVRPPTYEDRLRSKREKMHGERSGKMLLAPSEPIPDTNREPRGATKEQWVKQPYPVQNSNSNSKTNHYEENNSAPSDGIRAPRVHFVTQRRSESAPQPTYYYYDREPRSREFHRELPRENSREIDRDYYVRTSRHYNPNPPQYHPRFNNFYPRREEEYRDGHFERKYEPPRDYQREQPTFNKQRRIIYYATLPEVVRTPPNVDLRDRYNRNRFDDRYTGPSLSLAASDPYRFRKPYPAAKSRYEEAERKGPPYPLKVSTDVNVREIKKNPESRIYSEPERRYAYKTPSYQSDRDIYERRL